MKPFALINLSSAALRRGILVSSLALAATESFAYGHKDIYGSWALETAPQKTLIVATNATVWLHKDGVWRPGTPISPQQHGSCFRPCDSKDNASYAIWQHEKHGNNDVLFSTSENGVPNLDSAKRLVKAKSPDWDVIRNSRSYEGFWKPVRCEIMRGKDVAVITGPEISERMLLKIRNDNQAVLFLKKFKPTNIMKEPYGILTLVPAEGQFRVFLQRKKSRDLERGVYEALWLQPDGMLRKYDRDNSEVMIFERTDDTFEDPLDP